MTSSIGRNLLRNAQLTFFPLCCILFLSGCSALTTRIGTGVANDLSSAILNHDDLETVRDGAPAYLLMVDSFVQDDDASPKLLQAAAQLYAAYAAVFVEQPDRAKRLSSRARRYGERALCGEASPDAASVTIDFGECGWSGLPHESLVGELDKLGQKNTASLYAFTLSWLGWIRAHSDDFVALADLPKVETALNTLRSLDPEYEAANIQLYLGILNTLRPPALGGKPEVGRQHFERAVQLSGGRDLSAKVEYARGYAKLVYDRELHDRLLKEVMDASIEYPGYTLTNALAQRQAEELLKSADDYF
ncbi:MAG: TRAP transporter TatT component family protein [Pseudomonadota bacterium]